MEAVIFLHVTTLPDYDIEIIPTPPDFYLNSFYRKKFNRSSRYRF
jgi:hypothetical protein